MSLDPSELTELDRAAAKHAVEGTSFTDLVERYRDLVQNLDGYAFSIYDYDNDLSSRVALEEVMVEVGGETAAKAREALRDLDDRFLANTVFRERSAKDFPEWYGRLPRSPGPELASDIARGNL